MTTINSNGRGTSLFVLDLFHERGVTHVYPILGPFLSTFSTVEFEIVT